MLERSFTDSMPLLIAASTFKFVTRYCSLLQRCYSYAICVPDGYVPLFPVGLPDYIVPFFLHLRLGCRDYCACL